MATKTKAKAKTTTKKKAPAKRKPKAKKKETKGCEGCGDCKCGEEAPPPTSEQQDFEQEMVLMQIGRLIGMLGWGMMLTGEEGEPIEGCVIGTEDFCFDIAHAMGLSPIVGDPENS